MSEIETLMLAVGDCKLGESVTVIIPPGMDKYQLRKALQVVYKHLHFSIEEYRNPHGRPCANILCRPGCKN